MGRLLGTIIFYGFPRNTPKAFHQGGSLDTDGCGGKTRGVQISQSGETRRRISRRRSWEELACSLGHFLGNMELLWVNQHGLIGELKDKIPRWCPAWLLQLSAIPSELAQWVMGVNCKRFSNKNATSVTELD